jgi:lactate dehydrogenase-like 2-hydroxyacid dehydrogenase
MWRGAGRGKRAGTCQALETGEIAYAGVDVFRARSPLRPIIRILDRNILLTPHYAALSVQFRHQYGASRGTGHRRCALRKEASMAVNKLN